MARGGEFIRGQLTLIALSAIVISAVMAIIIRIAYHDETWGVRVIDGSENSANMTRRSPPPRSPIRPLAAVTNSSFSQQFSEMQKIHEGQAARAYNTTTSSAGNNNSSMVAAISSTTDGDSSTNAEEAIPSTDGKLSDNTDSSTNVTSSANVASSSIKNITSPAANITSSASNKTDDGGGEDDDNNNNKSDAEDDKIETARKLRLRG
mgnify:CR=1 FL=1